MRAPILDGLKTKGFWAAFGNLLSSLRDRAATRLAGARFNRAHGFDILCALAMIAIAAITFIAIGRL